MRMSNAVAAAAGLSFTATAAQAGVAAQAAAPCLSRQESEAFVTVIAPGVIRATAKLCVPQIGTDSYLGTHGEALAGRFEAASDRALPTVLLAVPKLTKGSVLADAAMLKTLAQAMIAPIVASQIKPGVCREVDRTLGYIDPLPVANAAGLFVQILQLLPRKPGFELPICRVDPN